MKDRSEQPNKARREFVGKAAAAAAAVSVAPGLTLFNMVGARPRDEAVTSAQRWGMLVDVNRCAQGCNACQEACNEENGITGHGRPATDAQWIGKVTLRDRQTAREYSLPLMCQHCEYPPCVDVCPTGASFRRADGIVLVDKHICIGCRYCMMACPYQARSFIHEEVTGQKSYAPRGKGTVESCTLCVHRVDSGRTPACAEACGKEGNQALLFGDLNDPNGELAQTLIKVSSRQLREDLGLNTGIRYHGI